MKGATDHWNRFLYLDVGCSGNRTLKHVALALGLGCSQKLERRWGKCHWNPHVCVKDDVSRGLRAPGGVAVEESISGRTFFIFSNCLYGRKGDGLGRGSSSVAKSRDGVTLWALSTRVLPSLRF